MIWCVEDDASIRDIEVYALQSTGFEAEGFSDGAQFWEAVQKERPELVVLDVMLPGIDGIELLRRMKARAELREIPVVMATAKGAEYDKIQGLDLGADYYLVKPFGVMELVSCVKAVLRRCAPMVPFDSGALNRSGTTNTRLGSGEVRYATPYARRWYYRPANFTGAPMRGNYWFERMKQNGGKDAILRGLAKLTGGNAK